MRLMAGPSTTRLAALIVASCLAVPTVTLAQTEVRPGDDPPGQGSLPDASFEGAFRKYTPPQTVYSPYYSWDASMGLTITVFRAGPRAFEFSGVFQTVGTENLGSRVGVGGTGYLLKFGYVRAYSDDVALSVGIAHFSSHLTRDLDSKTDEQRRAGIPIPTVVDPSEYNVLFVKGRFTLSRWPFTPELEAIAQPINFRFSLRRGPYVRPVYVGTRWLLRRGRRALVLAETQHEIGTNALNAFSLLLSLRGASQPEGRAQIFVTASPGHNLHVSPNIGALRDGIAVGIRLRFRG